MKTLSLRQKLSCFWPVLLVAGLLVACGEDAKPTTTLPPTSTTASLSQTTRAATSTAATTPTKQEIMNQTPPQIKQVTPVAGSNQPSLYQKFELAVELQAAFSNPFDPAQVDLQAAFSGPDGQSYNVPGFYYQDYESRLEAGKEKLTSRNKAEWRVRFTPWQTGRWSYRLKVVTPGGQAETTAVNLEVAPSATPGFVKVSPRDAAYLEFSNGAPYFAVGQNTGWYGDGGTYDYANWFKKMAANGANFGRVWMASWSFGLEWNDTGLGDYSKRLDRAWQLDRVFELAAENNIYFMLTLINHGAFSTTTNPEWDKNPYNTALGGPCPEPKDFATNATAREMFKRKLRYIAARWGYSPNLLAWEWWNEVEFTQLANRALLTNWVKEMTPYLQSFDPYNHLRTLSYGKSWDEAVFKLPEISFTQRHEYTTQDLAQLLPRAFADARTWNKPLFYGELGGATEGADNLDKEMVHLRNGQWLNIMSKGAGTSMNWWWDTYIDPGNLYELFKGPAAFMKGEDPAAQRYSPEQPKTEGAFSAFVLRSQTKVMGWVRSDSYTFREIRAQYEKALSQKKTLADFKPEYPQLSGQKLNLKEITPGDYTLEWWDTRAGTILNSQNLSVKESAFQMDLPDFNRDIAFKLVRK